MVPENSTLLADMLIRSVQALCNLYNLSDPRLSQVHVKGDLIINPNTSGRIMTRSRARANPDTYTIIPASLKLVKVLIEELLSASGVRQTRLDAAAAGELEENVSDDESWEDEDNGFLDLGAGMTKEQLMAFANEEPARGRDDETQGILLNFFREQAQRPGFGDVFAALTPDEQQKLRSMGG